MELTSTQINKLQKHKLEYRDKIDEDFNWNPTEIQCSCGEEIRLGSDWRDESQEQFREFIFAHTITPLLKKENGE